MRPYFVMLSWRSALVAPMLLALCALAACRGAGAGSSTAPTPIDADAAARRVLAADNRFAGLQARDPELIGQASWYEVEPADGGWLVRVRIGWGDCPAGCIDEHVWAYQVSSGGEVTLDSESGPPIPAGGAMSGMVTKGPICPVVHDPPDPSCADQPVVGAVLIIEDLDGSEVTRLTSAADGSFGAELAPGSYRIVPQPVDGLLGTAQPQEFRVEAGEGSVALIVSYDTGIR